MRKKAETTFGQILIILLGLMVSIAGVALFYDWIKKQEPQTEEKLECNEEICLYSLKGKICIEKEDSIDCVCITDDDCNSGICKKELGSKYGECS